MVKSQHKESKEIIEKLIDAKIIPVIKIDSPQEAVPLARALLQGGITVAEVTFRTEAAADGIAAIHAQVPEMLLGAGTVLTVENAQKAIDAGARFVVAPGFDPAVVDYVVEQGIAMIPGVATPTEVSLALGRGLHILKFFPAEVLGGIKMLDALAGPFPGVQFIPTGGITRSNMESYFRCKNVVAIGGSWMVQKDLVQVTELSREAVSALKRN
ncbi:MAG: bifunctional 4-hydroxy-2-oxoglutarate aldolase/2-dehydro-3-deoxy-phosphogluconate aldolase [Candidatus Treponema excrementipullorum]|nr:bifunctional 4-hydroxy-2-oxoglutarate aldolase/2-dehydro-3-deoxy-phosphogluconate aldolase [Spirochaetia bacterium]MDD7013271.1 bifunctional 4-hydroxy-2-oxoglutarate aldolase/2-dehydro-3-deoxy-phosphogluconate aldolase [Candidatus Treponema excrementipullorum]MDY4708034.1 bifunctional 4-hydroxy-2-oxoglutarate aldolase/2-dehydro-3-deoxy-phosphogluconate aldolase [Candidatus Treponema excrementipullorum]